MRGLRFWMRYFLETLGVGLLVGLFFLVLMGFGAEGDAMEAVLFCIPYYITLGCALSIMIVAFSTHILYIPLVLSMGSTRREAYWGFLLYRLASAAFPMLISLIVWLIMPGDIARDGLQVLPMMALVLLSMIHFGSLAGLAYQKLKILGIILLMVICGGVGGIASLLINGFNLDLSGILGAMSQVWVIGVLVWLILAAMDLLATYLALRSREVKL